MNRYPPFLKKSSRHSNVTGISYMDANERHVVSMLGSHSSKGVVEILAIQAVIRPE